MDVYTINDIWCFISIGMFLLGAWAGLHDATDYIKRHPEEYGLMRKKKK